MEEESAALSHTLNLRAYGNMWVRSNSRPNAVALQVAHSALSTDIAWLRYCSKLLVFYFSDSMKGKRENTRGTNPKSKLHN